MTTACGPVKHTIPTVIGGLARRLRTAIYIYIYIYIHTHTLSLSLSLSIYIYIYIYMGKSSGFRIVNLLGCHTIRNPLKEPNSHCEERRTLTVQFGFRVS